MELTRESIMAMSAGREIDELVAKYVFKIPNMDQWNINRTLNSGVHSNKYSTNIAAAWEIIRKLDAQSKHIEIQTDDELWAVRTNANNWVKASTVQEAICKCALITTLEG